MKYYNCREQEPEKCDNCEFYCSIECSYMPRKKGNPFKGIKFTQKQMQSIWKKVFELRQNKAS